MSIDHASPAQQIESNVVKFSKQQSLKLGTEITGSQIVKHQFSQQFSPKQSNPLTQ